MSGLDSLSVNGGDAAVAANSALSGDDRMRNEAFDQARRDAIDSVQTGGINLSPDTYLKLKGSQSPWDPTVPIENNPTVPGLPQPGTGDGGGLLQTSPSSETTASKIAREALVIGGGLGESTFYGIANLPAHLPQVGTSLAIGATLGAIAKTGKLGAGAALLIGSYFTTRFVLDTINDHRRWDKFADTIKDTWQSGDHIYRDIHNVRNTLGDYAFNTALSMASGYVGYNNPQIGDLILGALRIPPVVPATTPPFNPAIAVTGMYLDVLPPSGFYQNYEDRPRYGTNQWHIDLHGDIHKLSGTITGSPGMLGDSLDGRDGDGDGDDQHHPDRHDRDGDKRSR